MVSINYWAILAGIVANVVVGFLWYGPIFGKAWAREVGLPEDFKPSSAQMAKSMALMILGSFLIVFCLAHNLEAWRFLMGQKMPDQASPLALALNSAGWTWLGFFVPLAFNAVAWEGKSWKLFGINTSYYLVSLLIMSFLCAYWV